MKASDLFVRCLEEEGVKYVFGVPGEENLDFIESLRNSSIKLILTRHEQGAGFMAATHGRLTGEVGVCLATLGPGATNFVTAAAYAQLGAMPMLMITGQKPIKQSKQGQFQIVDIVDMMRPLTKYTRQIVSGDGIPSKVREAFRRATEERPGAVHLELPEDIAVESTERLPIPQSLSRRPIVEEKALQAAITLLNEAKHPIVLVGAAANRKLTCKMLRTFLDTFGFPVISTQMGKGVVDERSDEYIGCAALSDKDFVHRALQQADLVLNIGHDVVEKPPFFMSENGAKVIHINFSSAEVDQVYFPQVELIGDIANTIWQLTEKLNKNPAWDFSFFYTCRHALQQNIEMLAATDTFPCSPGQLVREVRAAVPDDGIIALDNGMYKIWFARNYPAYNPNTVLLDNALATMGAGLPSAMAAKLLNPDKVVVAICGDGGFMMNSQEIETACRLNLNVVVLILKDDAYGMIEWKQASQGLPEFGLKFNNPDFVLYAESYGAKGYRAEKAGDISKLIKQAANDGCVSIIEVPVDYSSNRETFSNTIPLAVAAV